MFKIGIKMLKKSIIPNLFLSTSRIRFVALFFFLWMPLLGSQDSEKLLEGKGNS